jgi:hypothetical protein
MLYGLMFALGLDHGRLGALDELLVLELSKRKKVK